jgi:hypothetical protein
MIHNFTLLVPYIFNYIYLTQTNVHKCTLLKQANKGPHMNSLEQFYNQLFAYNKKLQSRHFT